MKTQSILIGVVIGLLATLIMDLGGIIAFRFGLAGPGPRRTGPHLIGRWFLYLFRGKFSHAYILDTPPMQREAPVGLLVHYSIGAVLAVVYFALLQALHATPTLFNALIFGIATTSLAWFYLYPAWGYGWLGADARGARMTYIALYNHLVYGLGIALWTSLLYPG
jgi:hypothetical protein